MQKNKPYFFLSHPLGTCENFIGDWQRVFLLLSHVGVRVLALSAPVSARFVVVFLVALHFCFYFRFLFLLSVVPIPFTGICFRNRTALALLLRFGVPSVCSKCVSVSCMRA